MKKTVIIAVIIIVLAALGIWFSVQDQGPAADTEEVILGDDTTSAINEDLDSLDLGDIDSEFEAIDAELDQL